MDTNCVPLLADIFLYSYEAEFINLCSQLERKSKHLSSISHTDTSMTYCHSKTQILIFIWVRCIPLSSRSKTRRRATPLLPTWIYSRRSVNRLLRTSLYDKRDDFNFHITNFPFVRSNFPSSPAYGVFISQLIRYARACSYDERFILRAARLSF